MAFMNVPLLEHLYLRSNRISSIETGQLFQVFKKLEVLDLSDNRLTKVTLRHSITILTGFVAEFL